MFAGNPYAKELFKWSVKTDNCRSDLFLLVNFSCFENQSKEISLNLKKYKNSTCAYQGYFDGMFLILMSFFVLQNNYR